MCQNGFELWFRSNREKKSLISSSTSSVSHWLRAPKNHPAIWWRQSKMVTEKQSLPSFSSLLSVLSILFYCAGFLRVELELNEQKKRINALEIVNNAENNPRPSFEPSFVELIKRRSPGKFVSRVPFTVFKLSYLALLSNTKPPVTKSQRKHVHFIFFI